MRVTSIHGDRVYWLRRSDDASMPTKEVQQRCQRRVRMIRDGMKENGTGKGDLMGRVLEMTYIQYEGVLA